jgi:hypothetical protein
MKKSNRISFSKYDSNHLYELSLEHFQEGCFVCNKLKKRLQDFIGKKNVQQIRNVIKKGGYCKIYEEKDTDEAIDVYKKEKKQGKLKVL